MRPQFKKTAVALMACSSLSLPAVHAAEWQGSYSSQGQCYCIGEVPAALRNTIVPTPVGGQAVAQVCSRLGTGPGLTLSNGLFNHPVYADVQCGNGPMAPGARPVPASCAGSLDGKSEGSASCQPAGPRWNLKAAYAQNRQPAAAQPASAAGGSSAAEVANGGASRSDGAGLLEQPVVSSMSVERPDEQSGNKTRTLKATVISSQSAAGRAPSAVASLEPFTGKKIVIDGQRYLQARDGLPAYGGAAGSRIILDDIVFLRDDGTINAADLYRVQKAGAPVPGTTDTSGPSVDKSDELSRANLAKARELADAESTARQIAAEKQRVAAQRKRLREREAVAVREKADAEKLKLAKQQLEMESARKAHAALQAHAAELARQSAVTRQAEDLAAGEERERIAEQTLATGQARLSQQSLSAETEEPRTSELERLAEQQAAEEQRVAQKERAAEQKRLAEQDQLAEQKRLAEQDELAEQKRLAEQDELAEQKRTEQAAAAVAGQENADTRASSVLSALRLPSTVRASSRNFDYLEAMPVSYDVGGNGMTLEGSASSHSRFQYVGRLGVTGDYREIMLGGGYYLTPANADRLTVVLLAGVEYGSFELVDEQDPSITVDFDDSGIYLGAASRLVVNSRFELKAGVGYSSFFEGDAMLFGGGYYHISRQFDLVTRFEVGDNDLLGIGVRFYY